MTDAEYLDQLCRSGDHMISTPSAVPLFFVVVTALSAPGVPPTLSAVRAAAPGLGIDPLLIEHDAGNTFLMPMPPSWADDVRELGYTTKVGGDLGFKLVVL